MLRPVKSAREQRTAQSRQPGALPVVWEGCNEHARHGAIIARLAWSYDSSEENNKVFGRVQSFVAGAPKNDVQFMVKDSREYAATGGWGSAQFDHGKPADEAMYNTCFARHEGA